MVQAELAFVMKVIDEASTTMEKIKSSVGLLGSALGDLGGPMAGVSEIMTGFAAGGPAGAGIAAFGQISGYLQGAVKDAGESERVFTALGQAITNQGGNWDSLKSHVEGVLTSMQSTSRFSDEELAASLRTLVSAGMPLEDALKALSTAMDTAVGSGQPLNTVSTDIAKAFGGQDSALTRLVPGMADLVKQLGPGATEGEKFDAVMGGLNQKFSGQAAADAATYAGTQERMSNAMNELGEKVGTIVLPALTGMTDALIPIVDSLGKGVDAVSAWMTEVGKMPEVKGALDLVDEAFKGLWGYLQDLWTFAVDQFGPVLTELVGAFKDLWDALSPIGEAIGQIVAAITGGQGDFDLFKAIIQGIVLEIKGVATIIKDVAPYIKQFADAFKAAADFITPILTQTHDAIAGFLDTLKTAFQGFYNWLVGGSLWTEMWNQMLTTASRLIGQLISDLGSKFFDPMKTAFTNATQAVQKTWDDAWNATKTTLDTLMPQIQTDLNTALDGLKSALSTSTGTYGPTMTSALGGMQGAMNAGFLLVKGDWQGALDAINGSLTSWGTAAKGVMDGIMSDLQGAVKVGLDTIKSGWDTFVGALQSGVGTLQDALNSAGGSVQNVLTDVGDATEPATSTVANAFQGAFDTISTAATNFWNWLTGESLWPDMLDLMAGQTRDRLLDIASTFNRVFTSIDQDLSARFRSMSEGTRGAMGMILQVIVSSLTEIRNKFMSTIRDVEASWSNTWTELSRVASTTAKEILDGLTAWWSLTQTVFLTGLTTIGQEWQLTWATIRDFAANICGEILAGLTTWYQLIQDATSQNLTLLRGNFETTLTAIYDAFTSRFNGMVASAQSSMASIVSAVSSGLAQVTSMAAQMSAAMVQAQAAQAYMAASSSAVISPTVTASFTPSAPVVTVVAAPTSTPVAPQSITIPITTAVSVDGQTVAKQVETRIVKSIDYRGRR